MFFGTCSRSKSTTIGYLALLLWSTGALAATKICQLPVLQVLTTTFAFSFLATSFWLTATKRWVIVRSQPWYVWCIGVAGVCFQQFSYIAAFKNAPAIQADVLILLWPILVILLNSLFTKEKLTIRHIIAGGMGLTSVYLLNRTDDGVELLTNWYSGYNYALICAVLWSIYTLCTRHFINAPSPMIGMYYGLGILIVLPLHLGYENYVMPSLTQWLVLGYIGLFISGVAYFCWDRGVKKGNIELLATLSYGNSIISIVLLILFTNSKVQGALGWSCVLICIAGLIASQWFSKITRYCLAVWNPYYFTWTRNGYTFPKIYVSNWRFVDFDSSSHDYGLKIFWKIKSQYNCNRNSNVVPIQVAYTHPHIQKAVLVPVCKRRN